MGFEIARSVHENKGEENSFTNACVCGVGLLFCFLIDERFAGWECKIGFPPSCALLSPLSLAYPERQYTTSQMISLPQRSSSSSCYYSSHKNCVVVVVVVVVVVGE